MKIRLPLVVLLLITISSAASAQSVSDMLSGSAKAFKDIQAILNKYEDQNADLIQQINITRPTIQILELPAPTAAEVRAIETKIDQMQLQIAVMQKQIELSTIKDPKQREARAAKVKEQLAQLEAKLAEANKPRQKEVDDYAAKYKAQSDALNTAFQQYVRVPDAALPPVKSAKINAVYAAGQINITWMDGYSNTVAMARLQLGDRPNLPENTPVLAEVVHMTTHSNNGLIGWVGPFQVAFQVTHQDLLGKDKQESNLVQLLDLAGLALLTAETKTPASPR